MRVQVKKKSGLNPNPIDVCPKEDHFRCASNHMQAFSKYLFRLKLNPKRIPVSYEAKRQVFFFFLFFQTILSNTVRIISSTFILQNS